jgi:hypothetical protein
VVWQQLLEEVPFLIMVRICSVLYMFVLDLVHTILTTSYPNDYFYFTYIAMSERDSRRPFNVSTSLPFATVDETSLSIHKSMRLLKAIEATETWQQGRRYLTAPAALAGCPLTVVSSMSGTKLETATQAAHSETSRGFGIIDLGQALITYVGGTHHLSLGKWSSCRLVLRQNFLLEYDTDTHIQGLPRGFAHLQFAVAYPNQDFADALELQFYASPCAKADQRVVSTIL